jgi:acyl carrier protein
MDRFAKVDEIIADVLDLDEDEIDPDMVFEADLGADELDLMVILTDVESEYGISLTDAEYKDITTVGNIYEVIVRRQGK